MSSICIAVDGDNICGWIRYGREKFYWFRYLPFSLFFQYTEVSDIPTTIEDIPMTSQPMPSQPFVVDRNTTSIKDEKHEHTVML